MRDSTKTLSKLKLNGLQCSSLHTNLIILSQKTTRWITHKLPLVNPYQLFPVTCLHMPRKVGQKDLTHGFPQDWSEADQPGGPWIILWAYSENTCNICLCWVIKDLPAPPWIFTDDQNWHHYDTVSSAPLGAAHQVPRTHMAHTLSSSPSLCFHLLPTAVSSLNPASKHSGPEYLTAKELSIKALSTSGESVPTIAHSATSFSRVFV